MPSHSQPLKSDGMGLGAYCMRHYDVFSQVSNSASLVMQKGFTVGILSERKYMIPGLSFYKLATAVGIGNAGLGFALDYFGAGAYSEMNISFAYARSLGKKLALGSRFHYFKPTIAGYTSPGLVAAEAGLMLSFSEQFQTGFKFFYPATGSAAENGNPLSPVYCFGLGYEPSEKLLVGFEMIKQQGKQIQINAGLFYDPLSQLWTRIGIVTTNSSIWASLGTAWENWKVGVSTSFHQRLGITPGLIILYQNMRK